MDQKQPESANPAEKLTLLEQVKLQAAVLVPVLKAVRAEIGAERANHIVTKALADWSRKIFDEVGANTPGKGREKWAAMVAASSARIGSDIDIQFLRQDDQAIEFNITGCRYADFFHALGEPELGGVLLCDGDFQMTELAGGEVELQRTQTIMKGARYCDFRYTLKRPAKI